MDHDDVWRRFVDGESVDPDELARLVERAHSDETLRARLLADVRFDGWMRGLLTARRDGEAWVQTMTARLVAEQTRDAFVARVQAGIEGRSAGRRLVDWIGRQRAWLLLSGAGCVAAAGWLLFRSPLPHPTGPTATVPTATLPLAPVPPAARQPARDTLSGSREIIRMFDFEDGARSPGWHVAPTRQCPPHRNSRFCLMARKDPADSQFPDIVGVRIENRKEGIFVHKPGTVIVFDYWLGQSTVQGRPRIGVWLNDDSLHADYHYEIEGAQTGRWVHVEIPVDGFRAQRPSEPPTMTAGSRVGFMLIQTSWSLEDVLFVDDVRFEQPGQ